MTEQRRVLLLTHPGRAPARDVACQLVDALSGHGLQVRMLPDEAIALDLADNVHVELAGIGDPSADCELVVVIGGDGTILRAAELAHDSGTPLLGVNLGHVGFLAEAEQESLNEALRAIIDGGYEVEERMTVDAVAFVNGAEIARSWALNEVSVEKSSRERILEVVLEVDCRPLSAFGCDGVLCSTPTGSTAYAFSAGGPILWPQVQALLLVPSNAHALFARPLVISPDSRVALEVSGRGDAGVLVCDGRRTIELPPGARVEVARGLNPVLLARLRVQPFTDRLVRKFELPVQGWRGRTH
jgi:NAD+ kinase